MKKINRQQFGQSLVEILVAIGIFLVVTGSVVAVISGGQNLLSDTSQATQSAEYAAEGVEATRAIRDADWSMLTDGTHGLTLSGNTWQFGGASDTRDIFTRSIAVQTVDPNTKNTTTTITWQTDPLRPQRIDIPQTLTSWQTTSPTLCNLSGNWANPQVLGSAGLGAGRQGTDVVASGTVVYISNIASDSTKNDLSIYDVSNPASPQLLGSLSIGAGINSIVLNNGYIFAATTDSSKEFVAIDVRNPAAPLRISSLKFSGNANANSITYWNNYAVIGRDQSTGSQQIEIVDVTNPSAPLIASEIAVSASVLKVYAFDNRLYYSYDNGSPNMSVRDISSLPSAPIVATWTIGSDNIYGMYAAGDESALMLGSDIGNVYDVDASTITAPVIKSRVNVGGRAWDAILSNGIGVVGSANSNNEFQVVNASNPSAMAIIGQLNLAQIVNGITCYGNTVYAAVRSNTGLQIIGPGP